MGDIILTSPIIRCLKEQTGAEIHFLVKESFTELVNYNPHISKVISFSGSMNEIKDQLTNENYDQVIDLQKNRKSTSIAASLKIPLVSFNKVNIWKWLLVQSGFNFLPNKHLIDRYFDALTSLNISNDYKGSEIHIPEAVIIAIEKLKLPPQYIVIGVGAQHKGKCLSEDQLTHVIIKSSIPIILLGGPRERDLSQTLASLETTTVIHNLVGSTSILESAEIIRTGTLVLSGDTGTMHMASAFSIPQVSVWGCTKPILGMFPYMAANTSVILEPEEHDKRPCAKLGDKCKYAPNWCIQSILPERISEAIEELLLQE